MVRPFGVYSMKLRATLAATAALLLGASSAGAAIIPSLTGVTANASDYTFTYQGTLAADAGLNGDSWFVIYDFIGYVPGSIFSPYADVAATAELVTAAPVTFPGSVDDPSLVNLVFTYNGPDFHTSGGPYASLDFSGLSARSIYGGQGADTFFGSTVKNNPDGVPGGSGTPIYDVGFITVPAAAAVPEPATWAMMIFGLGAIGSALRNTRRRPAMA